MSMRSAQAQSPTPNIFDVHPLRVDQISCVLAVEGELDLATIMPLRQALDEQLSRGRRFAQLNLARLTFCDAAGLGALIQAQSRLASAGGDLGLIGCSPRLLSLLEMTGLLPFLNASAQPSGSERNSTPQQRLYRGAESSAVRS
jgi:anti-anti-sigma factor